MARRKLLSAKEALADLVDGLQLQGPSAKELAAGLLAWIESEVGIEIPSPEGEAGREVGVNPATQSTDHVPPRPRKRNQASMDKREKIWFHIQHLVGQPNMTVREIHKYLQLNEITKDFNVSDATVRRAIQDGKDGLFNPPATDKD